MRYLFWGLTFIIAALGACFAISNRAPVELQFWPLPYAVAVPLFLTILVALGIGLLVGVIIAWLGQGAVRRDRRALRRQVAALEREIRQIKPVPAANGAAPSRSLVA